MIEREEALDAETTAAENFFVQLGAKFLKIFEAVGHRSLPRIGAAHLPRAGLPAAGGPACRRQDIIAAKRPAVQTVRDPSSGAVSE